MGETTPLATTVVFLGNAVAPQDRAASPDGRTFKYYV